MARATYWVMDGTFKVAQHIVCQVYAIHASVNGKWVPLVIVLMVDRHPEYKAEDVVLTYLRAMGHNLSGFFQ